MTESYSISSEEFQGLLWWMHEEAKAERARIADSDADPEAPDLARSEENCGCIYCHA